MVHSGRQKEKAKRNCGENRKKAFQILQQFDIWKNVNENEHSLPNTAQTWLEGAVAKPLSNGGEHGTSTLNPYIWHVDPTSILFEARYMDTVVTVTAEIIKCTTWSASNIRTIIGKVVQE